MIIKACTYNDFGTLLIYFNTIQNKIPLRRVGGKKMTDSTKMQTWKQLVDGSFLGTFDFSTMQTKHLVWGEWPKMKSGTNMQRILNCTFGGNEEHEQNISIREMIMHASFQGTYFIDINPRGGGESPKVDFIIHHDLVNLISFGLLRVKQSFPCQKGSKYRLWSKISLPYDFKWRRLP